MKKEKYALLLPMLAALASAAGISAADEQPAQKAQPIYGSQFMTQERNDYRVWMRAAKTVEERQPLRVEHHQAMQARTKERDVILPDQPTHANRDRSAKHHWTTLGQQ